MPFRRYPPRRRTLGTLLALSVVAPLMVTAPRAGAGGGIESKQVEAAQVAAQIDAQAGQIAQLAREQGRAESRLEQARGALAQAEADLQAAEARQQAIRDRLARHAIESYVRGGSAMLLTNLFRSEGGNVIFRRTYLQVAMGEDRLVLEDLRSQRQDLEAQRARTRAAGAEAEAANARLAGDLAALRNAEAAQQAALGRIRGELAGLVAAEQQRRDAEVARAVRVSAPSAPSALSETSRPAAPPSGEQPGGVWDCIRELESGNNYSHPNGGAYQFLDSTWHSLGQTGSAGDAPPALQDAMALELQERSGWDQWTVAPRCGRG